MARPNRIMKSYRLPTDLVERIEKVAAKLNLAHVDIVQGGIEMYLDKAERLIKQSQGGDK